MDRTIRQKFSVNELNPLLNAKADNTEISNALNKINFELDHRPTNDQILHILNDKVDKKEFMYYINSKPTTNDYYNNRKKIEELQKNFENFQNNFNQIMGGNSQQKAEIVDLQNILKGKANLDDVAEALELKADSNKVYQSLSELKEALDNKLEKDEIININNELKNNVSKKELELFKEDINNSINELMKNKSDLNDFKLISDAFQDMKLNMTQRVDDIDNDLDRLIENIKAQFQTTNVLISNIDNKKIENKDIEEINNILMKKLDEEKFNSLFNQFKNNVFETINSFKDDYLTNIKIFETKLEDKNDTTNRNYDSLINELNIQNNQINDFINNEKEEIQEINQKMDAIVNNFNLQNSSTIQKIKDDIKKINININERIGKKLDEQKFDSYLSNLKKEINSKVSIFNSKRNNEELMKSIEQKINNLSKEIDNKINISDIEQLLNQKADISLLNDKISLRDFNDIKGYLNNISYELKQKVDIDSFNNYLNTFNSNLDNMHNEILLKADISEVNNRLDNKINTEDLSYSLNNIKNDLNSKVNNLDFNNAMNNQAMINDIICNENQVGRWLWKTGKIKGGYAIPWDTQSVNTAPDNYIWEKDKTMITVIKGGIYQVSLGFYANKKPNVQIVVNSEMVINVNNSNNSAGNKNNGYNGMNQSNKKMKKMTGLSLIDFIILQDNSKIAVTYNGEEGFGFIGLKKL